MSKKTFDEILNDYRSETEDSENRYEMISVRVPAQTKELFSQKQDATNKKLSKALAAIVDKAIKDF